ncbi:MAG: metallophosphoesterase [Deltaproteobacteria bacterium]|nr:metallophosphoesterase [Deltaproteobacteria bacterium]
MKKIIHLSDLHIGFRDSRGRNLGDRFHDLVRNLVFEKQPAENYVVVITGDLVESATETANYDEVRLHLEALRERGFTVLVCPGNHDYGTGILGSKKFVRTFKHTFFRDPDFDYPKLDLIGEIAFIGLDSMAEELSWYDRLFAEGEIGKHQLHRLDQLLSRDSVRSAARRVVYLHHHPFDSRPFHHLKDSQKLGEALQGHTIDCILYGHNHAGRKHHGQWGIHRCYDAGTSTRKKGRPGHHRVINLDRDVNCDYDGNFLTEI